MLQYIEDWLNKLLVVQNTGGVLLDLYSQLYNWILYIVIFSKMMIKI